MNKSPVVCGLGATALTVGKIFALWLLGLVIGLVVLPVPHNPPKWLAWVLLACVLFALPGYVGWWLKAYWRCQGKEGR